MFSEACVVLFTGGGCTMSLPVWSHVPSSGCLLSGESTPRGCLLPGCLLSGVSSQGEWVLSCTDILWQLLHRSVRILLQCILFWLFQESNATGLNIRTSNVKNWNIKLKLYFFHRVNEANANQT